MAKKKPNIDAQALSNLLRRVHLKGTLEECVLVVKDGVGSVQAVDMSNNLFLACSEKVEGVDKIKLGIRHLSTLCKYLEDAGESSVSISTEKDKWIAIKRKGHGQLKCQLLDVEQVPTAVSNKDAVEQILGSKGAKVQIGSNVVEAFAYYMGLVKSKGAVFETIKGVLYLKSNASESEQFKLKLSAMQKDIVVEVNAEFLLRVLQTVEVEDKALITLYVKTGRPVIIMQDKKNFWALTPIAAE